MEQALESGKLDLTSMDLNCIPDSVFEIGSLSELVLRGNPLTELPSSIAKLANLKKLDLTQCCLSDLPPALAELKKLKTFNLQSNPLRVIPRAVVELKNLTELLLSKCSLTQVLEAVGGLKKLKILWLSDNLIRELPESLFSLPKLEKFFMRNNQISRIGPEIWSLPALKEFNANGNPLGHLPPGLNHPDELPKLRTVGLADCNISKIPDGFVAHKGLQKLVLEKNPLPLRERVLSMGDNYPYEVNIRGFQIFILGLNPGHPVRDTKKNKESWAEQQISVSQQAYRSVSKYDALSEVVNSVGRRLLEGSALESIPRSQLELFLVHEFRHQLADAGLSRFLGHYGWCEIVQEHLLHGFLKIGAVRYWHFVRELQALLGRCSESDRAQLAEPGALSKSKIRKELEQLDARFFKMISQEDPTEIHQQWCWENEVFIPRSRTEKTRPVV